MEYLAHYGVLGQKWGIRRYQNPDGTLTEAGRARISKYKEREGKYLDKKYDKRIERANRKIDKRKEKGKDTTNSEKYRDRLVQRKDVEKQWIENITLNKIKAEELEIDEHISDALLMTYVSRSDGRVSRSDGRVSRSDGRYSNIAYLFMPDVDRITENYRRTSQGKDKLGFFEHSE